MSFEEYKNTYFDGDEDKAIESLAYEVQQKEYKFSCNEDQWKTIASSLSTEQRKNTLSI